MLNVSRLDLYVLSFDPDAAPPWATAALAEWGRLGFVLPSGAPGEKALLEGGFRRVSAQHAPRARFFSNRQGGFHVRCPVTGGNIVPPFNPALEAWRAGGPRVFACPCGLVHPLEDLDYAPAAGFAQGWLHVEDVGGVTLAEAALRALPAFRLVFRRG
jgi:hypothetical protein